MAPLDHSRRYSSAWAINDRGQVVGIRTSNGRTQAVMWDHGRLRLITTNGRSGYPIALNERGDVLAFDQGRPVVWNDGRRLDLEVPAGTVSQPTAINNAGQAVGVSYSDPIGFKNYHVTLWEHGVARDLGQGSPVDINERGWIVGSRLVDGKQHAALWRMGRRSTLESRPE